MSGRLGQVPTTSGKASRHLVMVWELKALREETFQPYTAIPAKVVVVLETRVKRAPGEMKSKDLLSSADIKATPGFGDNVLKNLGDIKVSGLLDPVGSLSGAMVKSIADTYFQRPSGGELKKPDIVRTPHENDTSSSTRQRRKKKERLDNAFKDLKEGLPDSLGETKKLVESVEALLSGKPLDSDALGALAQAAAAELTEE